MNSFLDANKDNILYLLENNAKLYPESIIVEDVSTSINYSDFVESAKCFASLLIKKNTTSNPVVILLDKSIDCFIAMISTVYAGAFYTVLDTKSPKERLEKIISTLNPAVLITEEKYFNLAKNVFSGEIVLYNETKLVEIDDVALQKIREQSIDTDPVYIIFTSGSTGIPKGTIVNHHSIISYSKSVIKTFGLSHETVFGSQVPFYFSMSVLDVFCTIAVGAKLVLIPKMYFSFPVKLIQYLNDKAINTIYWVPTALSIAIKYDALKNNKPMSLKKILFAGEPMPTKLLNEWRSIMPDCLYANLFGPTEITDTCTYYIVDRDIKPTESVPIGKPFDNCEIIVLDDNNESANKGELCVRGSFLAFGYYNNSEKTQEVFVQNPLNKNYPELIYRTGDIVEYNEFGELVYLGRKDFQIKHAGYRIELGEIENMLGSIPDVENCVCLYDKDSDEILFLYSGMEKTFDELSKFFKKLLPYYMYPARVFYVEQFPINANGKIDRALLRNEYVAKESENNNGGITMEELLDVLKNVCPNVDFSTQKHLVSEGEIDSLSIVNIIGEIEAKFTINLTGDDIMPENFESSESIWNMIQDALSNSNCNMGRGGV